MIVIITSIIVSLTVLVSAFIGFTPNLLHIVESDFQRRATANAKMAALQFGQLAVRSGTLVRNAQFTYMDDTVIWCDDCTGSTCPPSATPNCLPTTHLPTQEYGDGKYLYAINNENNIPIEQDCIISAVSYGPTPTAASPDQLTVVTSRVIKPK